MLDESHHDKVTAVSVAVSTVAAESAAQTIAGIAGCMDHASPVTAAVPTRSHGGCTSAVDPVRRRRSLHVQCVSAVEVVVEGSCVEDWAPVGTPDAVVLDSADAVVHIRCTH